MPNDSTLANAYWEVGVTGRDKSLIVVAAYLYDSGVMSKDNPVVLKDANHKVVFHGLPHSVQFVRRWRGPVVTNRATGEIIRPLLTDSDATVSVTIREGHVRSHGSIGPVPDTDATEATEVQRCAADLAAGRFIVDHVVRPSGEDGLR